MSQGCSLWSYFDSSHFKSNTWPFSWNITTNFRENVEMCSLFQSLNSFCVLRWAVISCIQCKLFWLFSNAVMLMGRQFLNCLKYKNLDIFWPLPNKQSLFSKAILSTAYVFTVYVAFYIYNKLIQSVTVLCLWNNDFEHGACLC